nr:small ribosomal subunit protein mS31 isoform X3 [Dasypus novemcinctus]XP_058141618.1 small ribosomal subunit protein mS31 isoform X3 [Dasypus novemcinctus]
MKKDLLNIIKNMKVELSTLNVQTSKPPNRRPLKSLEATIGSLKIATNDTAKKRNESLSPELVAAASAVAESLPFDKQATKSELLRQLRQHEEASRAQRERERQKVSYSNIISDMKVARSTTARVSTRLQHQIQFDEESEHYIDEEKTTDLRKRYSGFAAYLVLFAWFVFTLMIDLLYCLNVIIADRYLSSIITIFFFFKIYFIYFSPLPPPPRPSCLFSVSFCCVFFFGPLLLLSAARESVSFCCVILLRQLSICAVPFVGRLRFLLRWGALLMGRTPRAWGSPTRGAPVRGMALLVLISTAHGTAPHGSRRPGV